MERRSWIVLGLIVVAVGAGVLFSTVIGPQLQATGLLAASDAARLKGTISVAGDNYLGYWFITSRELSQRVRQQGYSINWTNDGGNYAERHKRFAEGRYDIMVLPINSYLLHGLNHRYPGVIPLALSESKGADAIVGYTERIVAEAGRQPTVNDLNNPGLRVCVTPDSPSEFLLNVAIAHFALDALGKSGPWKIATRGSEDAYDRLRARQCDAAVLWEPDVSKALAIPGVANIFGSNQVSEMIVDVFVVRRQLIKDKPELVEAFFQSYLETVAHYASRPEQLAGEVAKDPGIGTVAAAERAINRIAWFGPEENCRDWFNLGLPGIVSMTNREKLVDTIVHVTDVMVRVGEVGGDPLSGNAYAITNSEVLARLCGHIGATGGLGSSGGTFLFREMAEEEWSRLQVIGRLRVVPITFDASTASMTREGSGVLDQIATALVHNYPRYRVLIKGHTAPSGEESANQALAQERAETVRNYLVSSHEIVSARLRAAGVGSREPLPRQAGEGELSYRNRLARVEFFLIEDGR